VIGNHWTLNFKEKENIAWLMVERLKITLALSDNQIGFGKAMAKL
jgi:hypothetical protein